MTKEAIFDIIAETALDILPELTKDKIQINVSLKELGANSIDRMDILVESMEKMKIKIPMVEFGNVKNIQGLVDLFYGRTQ